MLSELSRDTQPEADPAEDEVLEQRIASLTERERRLVKLYGFGEVDEAMVREGIAEVRRERAALGEQPRTLRPSPPSGFAAIDTTLLELVSNSPGEPLEQHRLMARLLRPDVLHLALAPALRNCLLTWRWVAARTFFERGWTHTFNWTFQAVKGSRTGYTRDDLRSQMAEQYQAERPDELLQRLVSEAKASWSYSSWLIARFDSSQPRDNILAILAGLAAAEHDLTETSRPDVLDSLWHRGIIQLAAEQARVGPHVAARPARAGARAGGAAGVGLHRRADGRLRTFKRCLWSGYATWRLRPPARARPAPR